MKKLLQLIEERGVSYAISRVVSKIKGSKLPNSYLIEELFTAKKGIEIGGPSKIFEDEGFIPLYKFIDDLDGCNFSNTTLWEGNIKSGVEYNYYKKQKGVQYISEATNLDLIPNEHYDFLISSHCLEHVANPLKAVEEWIRVIKKGAPILIVLPNKKHCFDHKRSITEFSHLLADYEENIQEDDLTHLEEILALHDLKRDKPAGTLEQFRERSLKNMENRALHHHVFNVDLLKKIFSHFELEILLSYEGRDHVILGKKK